MSLIGKGEIYMLIAPNGKKYIGQVQCYYNKQLRSNNISYTKAGVESRWSRHIRDSSKGNTVLGKSICKYGEHNFKVKTLLICDVSKLNYFEIKYIRQYNTMVPNGLNMIKGGGVHTGIGNPNYGRKLSDETKQKIRLTQIGKKLPESVKENMRKAAVNKVQPRRNFFNLPKYIYHVINSKCEGYEVRWYPSKKNRKFCSIKLTMNEKLELAKKYINI